MPNQYEAPSRSKVVKLTKRGKTPRQIKDIMGISRAMVYRHIERARQLGELPPPDRAA